MRQFFIPVLAFCLGGLTAATGASYARAQEQEERVGAWQGIKVIHRGTLVANPAALEPWELAESEILRPGFLVGFGCEGSEGKTLVAMEEDQFPACKEIRRLD